MLIRTGMGGQLSGSVGGVTASRNRGGQYLRNRSVPVNPNSTRQQAARTAFADASIAWRSLTSTQRGNWTAYADQTPVLNRLSEQIILSGNAMFIRTNAFRLVAGLAIQSAAPTTPGSCTLGSITSLLFEVDGTSSYQFQMTMVGNTALTAMIFQIGPNLSAGKKYFRGPYTLAGVAGAVVPTTVLTAIAATSLLLTAPTRYGFPGEPGIYGIRVRGIDALGRLSNVFEQITTAVAA